MEGNSQPVHVMFGFRWVSFGALGMVEVELQRRWSSGGVTVSSSHGNYGNHVNDGNPRISLIFVGVIFTFFPYLLEIKMSFPFFPMGPNKGFAGIFGSDDLSCRDVFHII